MSMDRACRHRMVCAGVPERRHLTWGVAGGRGGSRRRVVPASREWMFEVQGSPICSATSAVPPPLAAGGSDGKGVRALRFHAKRATPPVRSRFASHSSGELCLALLGDWDAFALRVFRRVLFESLRATVAAEEVASAFVIRIPFRFCGLRDVDEVVSQDGAMDGGLGGRFLGRGGECAGNDEGHGD
jgi:hypothetical protein